jgi:hypothetical protein
VVVVEALELSQVLQAVRGQEAVVASVQRLPLVVLVTQVITVPLKVTLVALALGQQEITLLQVAVVAQVPLALTEQLLQLHQAMVALEQQVQFRGHLLPMQAAVEVVEPPILVLLLELAALVAVVMVAIILAEQLLERLIGEAVVAVVAITVMVVMAVLVLFTLKYLIPVLHLLAVELHKQTQQQAVSRFIQ